MTDVPSNLIPTRITQLPEYTGSSQEGFLPYVLGGITYKVQFSNVASAGEVPPSRTITAGTGLVGGGDLSADRVFAIAAGGVGADQLDTTGVVAGVYGDGSNVPTVTVDANGRVTSVTTNPVVAAGYVPDSRTITAGTGLLGGGSLANDITLSLDLASATPQALGTATVGVSTAAAREDHVHPAVDLSDTNETQGALPLGRGGTGDALSPVAGAVVYSTGTKFALTNPGTIGQVLTSNGTDEPLWTTLTGTGTVTSVNASGGTTGMTFTGGPITTVGTLTLGGTLGIANGGTGLSGTPTNGQLLVGNGSGYTLAALTAGTGVSVTNGAGSITVTNTAPDQTVVLTGAGTTSISGTYPNFTITSSDQFGGTVTSVDVSGGTSGLTFSGGPVTTSGTITLGGTLGVANGGTALTATPTNGQLAIGNGTGYTLAALTAGTGVSVTNGVGSITVANTAPDQTVVLTGAGTTSISGTYPNFTITSNDQFAGTVTSVAASGGTTGLTFSGSPITSAGTLTLGGTLAVASGGTGATSLTSGFVLKGNGTSAVSPSVMYDDGTNIGIGTTSPTALLHISRNGGGDIGALVTQTNSGNGTSARYRATHGSGAAVNLEADNGFAAVRVTSNNYLGLYTNDTQRVHITAAGSVGIGTASPSTLLHVAGALTLDTDLAISSGGTNSSATPTAGAVAHGTGTAYAFTSAGTAGQVLLSNGSSAPSFGGIDGGTF